MSERQRLANKLGVELWDDELLALFALEKIETLEGHLRQALRQWKMYAEMQEERELLTEASPEAEMYRVANAQEGGMTGKLSAEMIRAAANKARAAAKCARCGDAYDATDRCAVIVLTANGQHWVCSGCGMNDATAKPTN